MPTAPCGPGVITLLILTAESVCLSIRFFHDREFFCHVPSPFLQEGAHFSSSGHILERQRKGGPSIKQNESSKLQQLLNDKKAIAALAKSPDAKALAKMLSQSKDAASLQQAAQNAARGDTEQLRQVIRSITEPPGGAELLQRLDKTMGGK